METLGKYTLLKKIASGGMAEIWVATTSVSGVRRVCVVKRILPHLAQAPDFVRMFLDEARVVATLTHPNIAQMYEVGEAGGGPFIAMEYLHGADVRTIKRALRHHHPSRMPLAHALHIGIGAAAGLHYAHEKVGLDGRPLNVVHRDISPQNLLVTFDGCVKVLDFGIAKSDVGKTETQNGTLKGKIPYMSPEQCACEPLDRRSDVYSLGVVLYELTTGHRVHPPDATEYEIMRAIVEGTVAPPSTVDPAYPARLEEIVQRCLAKDRRRRYPTARALQADLDAFAREERLPVSSLALSSYMSELFGKRAEAWREALAGGEAQLFELAAAESDADAPPRSRAYGALLEGRVAVSSEDPTRGERVSVLPAEPAPRSRPGPEAKIAARKIGDVSVVTLSGRLNERFDGAALAASLDGRVVLDLAGVSRVTSFGVRAWLGALEEAAHRSPEVFFARCAEPVVHQMSMIKGFAGTASVVSFHAPYRCERCQTSFHELVDCERDAAAIRASRAPDAHCPRCGASAALDDDPRSYLAFAAPYAGVPVPDDVRAALSDLARADAASHADPIEKTIDGRTTRVAVRAALGAELRWKRVLDGIEGDLEIDLGGARAATPEGAAALDQALRGLGAEVEAIRVRGCPRAVAERLLAEPALPRLRIVSLSLEGRCAPCGATRAAEVEVDEARRAARDARDPYAACKRCDAALSFAEAQAFLRSLAPPVAAEAEVEPRESEPISDESATGEASVASSPLPARASRARALFAVAALVTGGLAAVALLWPRTAPLVEPRAVAPPASAKPAVPIAPAAPPAWAAEAIAVEADAIFAVGRGAGATEEAALAAARDDALDHVAARLLEDLGSAPLAAFVRARPQTAARRPEAVGGAAARYLSQIGATSTPERADAHVRREGARVEVLARYRLRKDAYEAATAFYRRTAALEGMTVAPVFPLLERAIRTPGAVIVIAVDRGSPAASAGVREGDAILAVDGQAVASLDAIAAAAATTAPIELKLEAGGAARSVKLARR